MSVWVVRNLLLCCKKTTSRRAIIHRFRRHQSSLGKIVDESGSWETRDAV